MKSIHLFNELICLIWQIWEQICHSNAHNSINKSLSFYILLKILKD